MFYLQTRHFVLLHCKILLWINNFAKNLKNVRKDSGLTQKQVAERLQVVESCYANWEQGRTEPNVTMIRKLGKIFNVTIDDLFNGD